MLLLLYSEVWFAATDFVCK